ncbi:MAG TPA: hypothetical protein VFV38_44495 [Ktedonobacteraceae bacterium]|nr:hypothetical protein [Ktedonobacteraceae bacterium]
MLSFVTMEQETFLIGCCIYAIATRRRILRYSPLITWPAPTQGENTECHHASRTIPSHLFVSLFFGLGIRRERDTIRSSTGSLAVGGASVFEKERDTTDSTIKLWNIDEVPDGSLPSSSLFVVHLAHQQISS